MTVGNSHAYSHDQACGDGSPASTRSRVDDGVLPGSRSRWKSVRDTGGAAFGAVLGLAPHVLHHIGLLGGAALVTGASGNALFYVIGLGLSVPMLRRLYRRFHSPWAPAIGIGIFTALFSLSAFIVGPAISDTEDAPPPSVPTEPTPGPARDHTGHH